MYKKVRKLNVKSQLTLPKVLRSKYKMEANEDVLVVETKAGILIKPVESWRRLGGMIKTNIPVPTPEEIREIAANGVVERMEKKGLLPK